MVTNDTGCGSEDLYPKITEPDSTVLIHKFLEGPKESAVSQELPSLANLLCFNKGP